MQTNKQNNPDEESADRNRQGNHDPVQAGREAIEAGKLNEQNQSDEAKDADRWWNEG